MLYRSTRGILVSRRSIVASLLADESCVARWGMCHRIAFVAINETSSPSHD
jgi:hypothetical protein